jgi:hypothetical protein
VSRTNATGRQDVYRLTDRGGLTAELADVTWDNGEWEVRMLSCEGPPQVRRLEHGLRLSVAKAGRGQWSVGLRQARVKLNTAEWESSLYDADPAAHRTGSGVDVAAVLEGSGARVGSRADLLGDVGHARRGLCAVFGAEASTVPVTAYVITRVLPLKNMCWAAGTNQGVDTSDLRGTGTPDRRRHLYVVLLDLPAQPDDRVWVYVGETGIATEQRFRQHLLGYRASRWVRHHGVRLMPELYEGLPTFDSRESKQAEAALGERLRAAGYGVKGGH